MNKQTPPPQQNNRPKSNAQINPPQSQKGVPVPNLQALPQAQQQTTSTNPGGLSKRNSIIRKLSQRKVSKFQSEEANKPNWKVLSTGLEMLINEEQVKKIWSFDKPKIVISEILNDLLKRLDVQKNFESMELNIIAEFHLYNIIYAKQTLFLDDYKTAIFLNLMWTLLINDNPDYKILHRRYTQATINSLNQLNTKNVQQIDNTNTLGQVSKNVQQIPQSSQQKIITLQNIQDNYKTIQSDVENFKKWIIKHSTSEIPNSMNIFDAQQIQMIVRFAQNSYFSNFSLYNYCLNNKNKNDEIEIQLFVDKPLDIPPLSDALYMGQPKIEIPEDEEDDHHSKQRQKQKKVSYTESRQREASSQFDKLSNKNSIQGESIQNIDSENQRKLEEDEEAEECNPFNDQEGFKNNQNGFSDEQKRSSQSKRSIKRIDSEEQEIRNIVNNKLKSIEEQFQQTIQKRQEELDKQFDEIVNPKKKK
ncbi:hypothetical protein ABPG72_008028 [Tetrahymena utriculariae]